MATGTAGIETFKEITHGYAIFADGIDYTPY
jgi:hypothetical protein